MNMIFSFFSLKIYSKIVSASRELLHNLFNYSLLIIEFSYQYITIVYMVVGYGFQKLLQCPRKFRTFGVFKKYSIIKHFRISVGWKCFLRTVFQIVSPKFTKTSFLCNSSQTPCFFIFELNLLQYPHLILGKWMSQWLEPSPFKSK